MNWSIKHCGALWSHEPTRKDWKRSGVGPQNSPNQLLAKSKHIKGSWLCTLWFSMEGKAIPSGELTWQLKMAIEIVDFPIQKWWFSIAMLVHQRVFRPSVVGTFSMTFLLFNQGACLFKSVEVQPAWPRDPPWSTLSSRRDTPQRPRNSGVDAPHSIYNSLEPLEAPIIPGDEHKQPRLPRPWENFSQVLATLHTLHSLNSSEIQQLQAQPFPRERLKISKGEPRVALPQIIQVVCENEI